MSNVLDIIIIAVVAVAAWRGYRKGLVMTLDFWPCLWPWPGPLWSPTPWPDR